MYTQNCVNDVIHKCSMNNFFHKYVAYHVEDNSKNKVLNIVL